MKTTLVKERIDEIVLELVHAGSMMQRGKTISAYMFPEATQAIQKLIDDECIKARIDGAQALADRIHKYRPLFHMPNKCKLCAVVDGHLDILKRELRATESPRKKGGVKDD